MRADRLARALAARTGAPLGWRWRIGQNRKTGLPATFRTPPAPYRERAYSLGPGFCCVCGQAVYRLGWHNDLWGTGPNKNAVWHCACVVAWDFWNAPNSEAAVLRRLQGRRCGQSGRRLWKNAEVDHRIPLFRVWKEYRDVPWAEATRLLGHAKPPGNQSRRPCHEMRHRGTRPTSCKLSRGAGLMSALPPKADIAECDRHVRFVPKADKVHRSISTCVLATDPHTTCRAARVLKRSADNIENPCRSS
jgi:hypothetical protein